MFALFAEALSPKRFAGAFAAAPTVALASMVVTTIVSGPADAKRASMGMIAGAIGFSHLRAARPADDAQTGITTRCLRHPAGLGRGDRSCVTHARFERGSRGSDRVPAQQRRSAPAEATPEATALTPVRAEAGT